MRPPSRTAQPKSGLSVNSPEEVKVHIGEPMQSVDVTYEKVDQLLYLIVDQRYDPLDCVKEGFEEAFIKLVMNRMKKFQFKRTLPPIAKISSRTVGSDFLYFRDWGT